MRAIRDAAAELTDVEPPAEGWSRVRATLERAGPNAEALEAVAGPAGGGDRVRRSGSRDHRTRRFVKAAVLVLMGAAAGVAAAAPGSPLHNLFGASGAEPGATGERTTGIAVGVPAEGLRIRLDDADPGLQIRMELVDRRKLQIEARGQASTAVFGLADEEVEVTGPGGGLLWIGAPRAGGSVRVVRDGQELVRSDGGRLIVQGTSVVGGPEVTLSVSPVEPMEEDGTQ